MRGQKPGHGRLGPQSQRRVDALQHGPDPPGGRQRDRSPQGFQSRQGQDLVDPLPAVDRFALADEIGPAGHGRTRRQRLGRQQVGLGGIFHVDHVDEVFSIPHPAQPSRPGPGQQPGNEVPVPRAPDQVRAKRTSGQAVRAVGPQHLLLGQGLAVRVMGQPAGRIGGRFVHTRLVGAVEGHAGAAGVDQPAHAVPPAALQHVPRAQRVDFVVVAPAAADPRQAGRVKHDLHALAGLDRSPAVAEVAPGGLHPQGVQLRVAAAAVDPHPIAPGNQLPDQVAAQKSPPAGNQGARHRCSVRGVERKRETPVRRGSACSARVSRPRHLFGVGLPTPPKAPKSRSPKWRQPWRLGDHRSFVGGVGRPAPIAGVGNLALPSGSRYRLSA